MSQWHTVATVGLIICPQAPGGLGYTIYCKSPRIKKNCELRYNYSFSLAKVWKKRETSFGPFSIYEQPKYKPNLNLTLTITLILTLTLIQTLILTLILTLKPTWVDATIRSHFGCSYIEKEPKFLTLGDLGARHMYILYRACAFGCASFVFCCQDSSLPTTPM